MGVERTEDALRLWGTAGGSLEVAADVDTDGELRFQIEDTHYDTMAIAHLGPTERRKLKAWLEERE